MTYAERAALLTARQEALEHFGLSTNIDLSRAPLAEHRKAYRTLLLAQDIRDHGSIQGETLMSMLPPAEADEIALAAEWAVEE